MAGITARLQPEAFSHKAHMHVIALIERHRRCLGQRIAGQAMREVAGNEGGAGGKQIVHLTELINAATRQRLGMQADCTKGLTLADLVEGAALVIDQQVEFDGVLFQQGGNGGQKPGGRCRR